MDAPLHVTVLDDYQGVALSSADWTPLEGSVDVRVINRHVADERELRGLLADTDVLVAMRERTALRSSLLDELPRLRLIVTTGPFNAAIDVGAAPARGITVCGTGGYLEPTVELTCTPSSTPSRPVGSPGPGWTCSTPSRCPLTRGS